MTVELFKEILTEPALKDFALLYLDKGEIDEECLNMAMETATARRKRDLYIIGTKVPENYYHENAFKFNDVVYCYSKWVRIEHLFTLKNTFGCTLERHSLTGSDVNTFIKFWIHNDQDMVRALRLTMSATFQPAVLFDGVIVLEGRRRNLPFYLFVANPMKQRKYQIMGVVREKDEIHLYSSGKDQPIRCDNFVAEAFEPEYEVLLILNKRKELEDELERIQNLLETNQDQNMVEKKNDISRELQSVSVELDNYKLVLRDGIYRYM
ncbi:hypothetical protein CAEBREN_24085 [Caenorhabditis brenneri]|uniref:Sdz-33 F-box domain-containing protein n=1 Tax=Caenorhabditis brenneri TaxID=135651 RepID=G0MFJ6_CAEBE|nr:hypothetical protein CAEBREN_24085 [Caenorhabditis brenneri]